MVEGNSAFDAAIERVLAAVAAGRRTDRPYLVGLDGGSGSGKSTFALALTSRTRAALVASDDFFAAEITTEGWARRSAAERAKDCIDWRRLRTEALEPLLTGHPARWHPFDFDRGPLPDGTYLLSPGTARVEPHPLVVLEGAYSCRPELADLIDLRALVDAPIAVRYRRLASREDPTFLTQWTDRWDEAEDYYFREVCPADGFHLVVRNG